MKKILLTAFCLASISVFAAGDAEQTAQQCIGCHGVGGVSVIPSFPVLAGQHRGYLEHALKAYKSGERKNALMNGLASALSDSDIEGLAIYFSKQKGGLK